MIAEVTFLHRVASVTDEIEVRRELRDMILGIAFELEYIEILDRTRALAEIDIERRGRSCDHTQSHGGTRGDCECTVTNPGIIDRKGQC